MTWDDTKHKGKSFAMVGDEFSLPLSEYQRQLADAEKRGIKSVVYGIMDGRPGTLEEKTIRGIWAVDEKRVARGSA